MRERRRDGGSKLLAKTVDKTKDDYGKHAWGHGAYYMEYWGIGALRANRLAVAEEAFLEALAHDAGSVRGALGMQVVCERQGRTEEATRFAELAQRCWRKADPGADPGGAGVPAQRRPIGQSAETIAAILPSLPQHTLHLGVSP